MNVSRANTQSAWNAISKVLRCNLPSCHMSPNSNIWEALCRAIVTRVQIYTRGNSVGGTMDEDVRRPMR